ncbi:Porphobilinogen deaminase [Clostridiaceae bacterium JG1575]|nr:Porphobilinogen deaminase [Clostridiaceae bacterium JG1575]
MKKKLRVGTRKSQLAMAQASWVAKTISQAAPEWEVELVPLSTLGDRILDRTLDQVGGKGLFIKELEVALLEGRIDLAVHSLKDVPVESTPLLPLLAYSPRENPRDVLVLPKDASGCPKDAPLGTASLRRAHQWARLHPEASIAPVRGNLQTRLEKLDRGEYSALILAAAGLNRLGLGHRISHVFGPEEMVPSAAQGILGIQGRSDEEHPYLWAVHDEESALIAACERSFLRELGGGCTMPVGAHALRSGEKLALYGYYYDEGWGNLRVQGQQVIQTQEEAQAFGAKLAQALKTDPKGHLWAKEEESP